VVLGLTIAVLLVVFGVAAGLRQFRTLRRARDEPYMPDEDRRYFRGQARRRLVASALLLVIASMIAGYYLSGMDARMDAIPERNKAGQAAPDDPQAEADKEFTRFVGVYWIVVIVLLGLVVGVAVIDFWATRKYWMARYKEMKEEYDTKLQRDLAVYRQQKLNERAKGLRKPDDETPPEGNEPLPE
jgi:UPF0716 family protein affecting phage T7 exclusion